MPTVAFDDASISEKRENEKQANNEDKTDDENNDVLKIVVCKYRISRCAAAIPVRCTGLDMYVSSIKQVQQFLNVPGYKKVILRADQETSLAAVREKVKLFRSPDAQIMNEHSPVIVSRSNGFTERAVQQTESLIRALYSARETRLYNDRSDQCPASPVSYSRLRFNHHAPERQTRERRKNALPPIEKKTCKSARTSLVRRYISSYLAASNNETCNHAGKMEHFWVSS